MFQDIRARQETSKREYDCYPARRAVEDIGTLRGALDFESPAGELKKALAERMLGAEMDEHLAGPGERQTGNHRNGTSRKTVDTGSGRIVHLIRYSLQFASWKERKPLAKAAAAELDRFEAGPYGERFAAAAPRTERLRSAQPFRSRVTARAVSHLTGFLDQFSDYAHTRSCTQTRRSNFRNVQPR